MFNPDGSLIETIYNPLCKEAKEIELVSALIDCFDQSFFPKYPPQSALQEIASLWFL